MPRYVARPEPDYRALANFRLQVRLFLRHSEEMVEAGGLEPQQYQLMLTVKALGLGGDHVSISQIADALLLKHHSAVGLIDRMERKRIVTRHRDPVDHRRVLVGLTVEGEEQLATLAAQHQQALHRFAPQLQQALQDVVANTEANLEAAH